MYQKIWQDFMKYCLRGNKPAVVSTADRIESARITSTKLKALRKPRAPREHKPGTAGGAIDRLLAKSTALYTELKLQKTPLTPSAILNKLLDKESALENSNAARRAAQ